MLFAGAFFIHACASVRNFTQPPTLTAASTAVPSLLAKQNTDIPPSITTTVQPIPSVTVTPALCSDCSLTELQEQRLAVSAEKWSALSLRAASMQLGLAQDVLPGALEAPLAVRVLQDAGLVDPYLVPAEFRYFVASSVQGLKLVEELFPTDQSLFYRVPLDKENGITLSLLPGDLVTLDAGEGQPTHTGLITRTGSWAGQMLGLAISGDAIGEKVLLDLSSPGQGLLYDWLGSSVKRTASVWRTKGIQEPTERDLRLAQGVDAVLQKYGGFWAVLIQDANTGETLYGRRPDRVLHPASTIKVPLAMLVLETFRREREQNYQDRLDRDGTAGRTFGQLMEALLVRSEEEAAQALLDWVVKKINIRSVLDAWGARHTQFTPRESTARDMAGLLRRVYTGKALDDQGRQILLKFLAQYTPNDDFRIGALRKVLPAGTVIYNKRGTLTAQQLIAADMGIIEVSEKKAYLLALFGYQSSDPIHSVTYEALDAAIRDVSMVFWQEIIKPV